jgi:hypothetical protein
MRTVDKSSNDIGQVTRTGRIVYITFLSIVLAVLCLVGYLVLQKSKELDIYSDRMTAEFTFTRTQNGQWTRQQQEQQPRSDLDDVELL